MRDKIGHLAPFGLRMPQDIREWIAQRAKEQDRSMNWVVLRILEGARAAAEGKSAN